MKRRIIRKEEDIQWQIGSRQGERAQEKRGSCGFFSFYEKQVDTFWSHFVLTEQPIDRQIEIQI